MGPRWPRLHSLRAARRCLVPAAHSIPSSAFTPPDAHTDRSPSLSLQPRLPPLVQPALIHRSPSSQAWETLGSIMEREQSYRDAAEQYEQAWRHTGGTAAAVGYKLGFNYLKAGRLVDAVNVAHKVGRGARGRDRCVCVRGVGRGGMGGASARPAHPVCAPLPLSPAGD